MLNDLTVSVTTAVYASLSSLTNESLPTLFANYNDADLALLKRLQTAVTTEQEGPVSLPKKRGRPPLSDEVKAGLGSYVIYTGTPHFGMHGKSH